MVIFSGIQPTGRKHLGNYIGAIRQYVEGQDRGGPGDLLHRRPARDDRRLRPGGAARAHLRHDRDPAGRRPGPRRAASSSARATCRSTRSCAGCCRRVTRARRAQPHAPVPRQVGRAAPAGLRRAAALPGAAGRRRARLPRPRGAGGGGPARAPRADARRRRRFNARFGEILVVPEHRIPTVGARIARPAGARAQDVDDGRQRAGHGLRARRARRDPQEVPARGDGLGHARSAAARTSRASRT